MKSKVCKNLGKNIRKYRKAANMSQEELAEAIDMGVTSLSIIETGKGFITAANLEKIARVFGIEESELFKSCDYDDSNKIYNKIIDRIEKFKNNKEKLAMLDMFIQVMN